MILVLEDRDAIGDYRTGLVTLGPDGSLVSSSSMAGLLAELGAGGATSTACVTMTCLAAACRACGRTGEKAPGSLLGAGARTSRVLLLLVRIALVLIPR